MLVPILLATTNTAQMINSLQSGGAINWTAILSISIVCLVTMVTVIKLFGQNDGNNQNDENDESHKQISKDIENLEDLNKDLNKKREEIIEEINQIKIDLAVVKIGLSSNSSSIEELKKDYRSVNARLDELCNQILEYFS
jgi:septal ring factor EnvC (AmiA/AmiB activator)